MIFQKFDSATTPNKEIIIRFFQKGLKPSIWAKLHTRSRELDLREEIVKKAVNVEAKTLLQSASSTCNIDLRCLQENRPTKKENKDSGKTKSTNISSVDTSNGKYKSFTYQSQTSKKD